eukprot:232665-Prymnesium_polylepis.1
MFEGERSAATGAQSKHAGGIDERWRQRVTHSGNGTLRCLSATLPARSPAPTPEGASRASPFAAAVAAAATGGSA